MKKNFKMLFLVIVYSYFQVQAAELNIEKVDEIIKKYNITDLNDFPNKLPIEFLRNFVLKHSNEKIGPRGHLFEIPESSLGQGGTFHQPRVIIFDQDTGFTLSYNGGRQVCEIEKTLADGHKITTEKDIEKKGSCKNVVWQKNGHTLDLMEYDPKRGFDFWKWDFPKNGKPHKNQKSCKHCHGDIMRPIFSMYPDWPGFYGSDNDELTNPGMKIRGAGYEPTIMVESDYQKNELIKFLSFRKSAQNHPRYIPLFQENALKRYLNYNEIEKFLSIEPGRKAWEFVLTDAKELSSWTQNDWNKRKPGYVASYPWPYFYSLYPLRQAHTFTSTRDFSRAFFNRPGIRFNILMSRLHVNNLMRILKSDHLKSYMKFRKFFLRNIMMCKISDQKVLSRWLAESTKELRKKNHLNPKKTNLDVDEEIGIVKGFPLIKDGIRFKWDTKASKLTLLEYERNWMLLGFNLRDVDMRYSYGKKEYDYENYPTTGPMKIGYTSKDGSYFNSYNDGSTTLDELIAAKIIQDLVNTDKVFNKLLMKNTEGINWSFVESTLEIGDDGATKVVYHTDKDKVSSERIKTSLVFFNENGTPENISDDKINFWGLAQKYGRFPGRYTFDKKFFKKMDKMGTWINLPYAPEIGNDHHRSPWWIERTKHFTDIYSSVCKTIDESL